MFEENRITCCLNCSSSNPKLTLARLLEELYAGMATNKLAEPFLSSLLPGVLVPVGDRKRTNDDPHKQSSSDQDSPSPLKAGGDALEARSPPLEGLFSLLQRVRRLSFSSYEAFVAEVTSLRKAVERILQEYYQSVGDDKGGDAEGLVSFHHGDLSKHCVMLSFDSVVYEALHLSMGRQLRLRGITNRFSAPSGHKLGSAVLEERMLSLWRQECSLPLAQYLQHRDVSAVYSGVVNVVSPRSLSAWCRYLDSAALRPSSVEKEVSVSILVFVSLAITFGGRNRTEPRALKVLIV